MVNDTPLTPTGASVEEKRRLLAQKLQERAQRGTFPLSFSQQRLWFLHRMDPGSPAYHIPLALRALGDLDVRVLRRALRSVVKRHDALRTTFTERDGRPVQVVSAEAPDILIKVDLRGLGDAARERELDRLIRDAATVPFDLERGPLLRALAVRLDHEEWGLLFTLHHIIADGWSMGVLVRDLSELYAAHACALPPALAPMTTQYPAFALWQRGWLKGEVLERETAFWRGQLAGAPRLLELPTDRPRPAMAGKRGENRRFALGAQVSRALAALAREEGATLFMTLLSAWQLLLGRYAGQDDVLVGTPTAGRTREELEGVVGFFVNTLVLRARLDDGMSFRQLLRQVRETTLSAYAHQHLPFEKLVEEMGVERTLAHTPLFQAMFSLQNNEHVALSLGGTRFESLETGTDAAKFDLNLSAGEGPEGIQGTLSFRTDLFDGTTAERMLGHLAALLEAVAVHPDRRLGDHTLLGHAERRQVVEEWNRTDRPFPETCLHRLWEAQAARTPDAVAVLHGERSVTYAELDRAANRLAHALQRRGVGPEMRVALHLDNGPEQLTGILGVLKAGGAYVPLDTASPADRLAYVLEDSGAVLVLADDPSVLPSGVPALCLTADAFADESEDAPACAAGPRSLVYVIYTSGSTGRPKGVLVEHRGVCNTVLNYVEAYGIHADARVLHFAPVHFDASVTDLFTPLCAGATLVTAPREALIPGAEMVEMLRGQRVTHAKFTPSALAALPYAELPELEAVMTGGEACTAELVARWAPGRRFINGYGPTETSVRVTVADVSDGTRTPPIGRPVPNARLYVLDASRNPLPVGVAGELYIGGVGVARGYLGRAALTAQTFVPDPFSGVPGARLYRSGDRARWLPDGQLAFAGRVDFQVKIRGIRIEPGEVEAALREHAGLADAVVVAREDGAGGARLAAYVVGTPGADVSAAVLREHLKGRLPDYMVPAAFVVLEGLPLGSNGKVDRRALPSPDFTGDGAEAYVAPRTPAEEIMAGIFAEVLKTERVGARDDFFARGGHSLLATRVISRVRLAFGVELPLRALFEAPSVERLAARVEGLGHAGAGTAAPPLVPQPRDGSLPLSFAQQRLWFLDQLEPGSTAYHMPYALRLRGALDTDALQHSLTEVVRRHETLRTHFDVEGGEPVQVVAPPLRVRLPIADLRELPEAEREAAVHRLAADEAVLPFYLSTGPLFRARLARLADDEHVLLFTLHHIVSDAWSRGVLVREVTELYAAHVDGRAAALPALPVQYADFAAWQRQWLTGEVLDAQLGYWKARLAGAPPLLEIPTDRPRAAALGERGGTVPVSLPETTSRALRALARQEGATLFMTLLAAWQLVLSRWSGQDDVVVGAPVANRGRVEIEPLIGFFVNTLALRTDLSGDPTVRGLLARVREEVLQAQGHQDLPFERLVEALGVERAPGRTPVFQAVFNFLDADADADVLRMGGLRVEPLGGGAHAAKFDLTLTLGEGGGRIGGGISYRAELFDAATARRLADHLARALGEMAADPDRRISALRLLSAEERAGLLARSGRPAEAAYGTVHGDFARQAARTPGAVAVVHEDASLTYAELDARANRLAHHLRARGVGPDVKVALCMERSPEMVVGILGVLKAGGAYVPLDLGYPAERLALMARDADVRVLLTQERLLHQLPEHAGEVVCLDRDWPAVQAHPAQAPAAGAGPDHLAYVIYTSGSTGTPKGTEVPHRAIPGFFRGTDYARWDAGQVHLQHSSTSWDALTLELWPALLTGARCVLLPARASEPALLGEQVRRHGVTVLWLSAAYFNLIVDTCPEILDGVRQVMTGGEAVSPGHVRRLQETYPEMRLVNGYGPSECTVFASAFVVPAGFDGGVVPIGGPVGDRRVYLVDPGMELTAPGVPGELCVGGPAVARGYLGRPALTADRFVPDPFSGEPGRRMYRTGDRVRWRADGTLEFVGRVDFQAKVRGFRVEPGEVEAALLEDPRVREAVVVVREDAPGDRRLVAYAVPAGGAAPTVADLRDGMRARLPEYMVPQAFVLLEAMPLSAHGKLDRRALPAPGAWTDEDAYVAPRTPTEEIVAGMFAGVLRVDRVGAADDFFALGGHSLLATRLVSRVREAFRVELPLRALFEAPTVAGMAAQVDAALRDGGAAQAPPLVPVPRGGALPLSFAQQRLWFIDQLEPGSAAYNIPVALRLRGMLDGAVLERALTEITARHETLRTRFADEGGAQVQVVDAPAPVSIPVRDLRGLPRDEREARLRGIAADEAARPFDLAAGPLVRAALVRLDDEEHALLFTLHHIVSDGWSMGVLVREVSALYDAFSRGEPSPLAPLPVQYPDFAAWQRGWLAGDVLDAQLGWWRGRLAGAPPLLELPTDRPRPAQTDARGASLPFTLDAGTTAALRDLSRREGATLFMTLTAAWQLLLSRWSGQDDVTVGSPIAGRTRLETEGLIGFFVNTLVLRTDLSGDPSFRALLGRVRETTLGAFAHQDVPFEKLVEELAPERSLGHTPLFQAMLLLQNNDRETLRLGRVEAAPLAAETQTAKFDLSLALAETGDGLSGGLAYRPALWDASTMERMAAHLRRVLEQVAADPGRRISALRLLSAEERAGLLARSGRPAEAAYGTVHGDFARQVARTPDAVAVVHEDASLTYAELDARANRLAHHLRARGVGPDVKVALCMERSLEMVVGLLGVLKAGGAYVPLDLGYPAERLALMARDADVRVLLTQERLLHQLPEHAGEVVCLDRDWPAVQAHPAQAPAAGAGPDHLAYVIYTSGSTGTPKGTEVPHRAIPGFFRGTDYARWDAGQVHLQHSSTSWDALTLELWPALLTGARTVLLPARASEPALLGEQVRRHGVTVLWLSAAYLNLIVDTCPEILDGVRQVMTGGEAVSPGHVRRLQETYPEMRLVNGYGPSECTVFASAFVVPAGFDGAVVPIGGPVGDRRVYLVDGGMELTAPGVPGELCVGGPAVARGYLGRPALTADRFVPDPFSGEPGGRMYRTGDRVRWRADGTLEFVGRVDFQAKVRGFRVEPGEVEAALLEDPRVREAVVVVREDAPGDRRLVAYAVPAGGASPTVADLRDGMRARLPEYMVPQAFVLLEAMPLSAHGKLDRRALPAPGAWTDEDAYVAPRTPTEEIVAGMFAGVLRVDRVGAADDFFALGGHSLLATRLVSRVREAFRVELPLRALFEAPTVAGMAAQVDEALRDGGAAQAPPLVPVPRGGALPLSFAQQRLWFIDQLEPGSAAYNIPVALRLRGMLDGAVLEQALTEITARHETLRTRFADAGGVQVQVVDAPAPVSIPVRDLRGLPRDEREARLRGIAADEAARPFDLAAGPLVRAALVRLDDEEHALLFTLHHIVSDGWSMGVLVREVSALYDAFSRGEPSPLAPLPVQYADFAAWQRGWLAGGVLDAQLGWWRGRLAGAPPLLELPTDRPRPAQTDARGASLPFALDGGTTAALRDLSRREGATLFMTLTAAWQLLLSRYSGQDDVTVGSPIAGRTRLETEGLIGFFVNTLVLRTDLSGDPSFRALLGRVRETTLGAFAHQDVPFEKLVEELAPERSLGHTPLFQAMLLLQNNDREALRLGRVEAEPLAAETQTAKFDLSLALAETGDGLSGGLAYRPALWDASTMERMAAHLRRVLEQVTADPDAPLSALDLLDGAERRQVLEGWNPPLPALPDAGIARLFEIQAARTPDAVAVVMESEALTYAELNARANRLARHLRGRGVGPETRVGICLERGVEMVAAFLATLKAGGAYVPLDPGYPAGRLAHMLADSGVRLVLTREGTGAALPALDGVERMDLDREGDALAAADEADLDGDAGPDGLAYVIYTSGSTGVPRGVGVQHGSVVRLVRGADYVHLGADETVLQAAPVSFDASILEIWGALLNGGRLVLLPGTAPSLESLGRAIQGQGVSTLWLTAGLFAALVDERLEDLAGVRQLLAGGDVLPVESVRRVRERFPALRLINGYGPTENTTFTCCYTVGEEWNGGPVPIGSPISGTHVYVLDGALRPVPVGIPGELYAGGDGVARGYLGQPAATADRFVPDPFAARPGARMYRTGDRARWRADGAVEYLGRLDAQVKIRGFRVEPGEVESALRRHPAVADCVVVPRDDAAGGRRLVAYVVGQAEPEALREHLRGRLPEYMLPGAFVRLDAIPLTSNGKVDRRALPAPELAGAEDAYAAPRTPVEEVLAGIWAEVLGIGRVGVEDGFFDLGGHSLLATRMISRVRAAFGVELELRALFEGPTVAALAERVEALRSAGTPVLPPVVPVERTDALPLSFSQERLWFLDRLEPGTALYNVPAALRLSGALDAEALERALGEVVRRHEALRTTFAEVDDVPVQVVVPFGGFRLAVEDLSGMDEAAVQRRVSGEAARPFDLAAGPLFRAALLRLADEEHVLLVGMHHVVSDGWSMDVLQREMLALYGAFREGRPSPLPELAVQYADYAAWQRAHLAGEALQAQLAWWAGQLAGAPALLELPTDRPRPAVQTHRGTSEPVALSAALAERLRALGRAEGATLYMVLLGAFQVLLSRYGGTDDVVVGSPTSGRSRREVEGLIGFFVNTLVLRTGLSGDPTFRELLGRVRTATLGAWEHQDLPFERLVAELQPERSLSHSPLFQVMFTLDNADAGEGGGGVPGLDVRRVPAESQVAKFDLSLGLLAHPGGIAGGLSYSTDLFDRGTVVRMLAHLERVLEQVTADPDAPLSALDLLDGAERRQVLEGWNPPLPALPDAGIARLFEAQAARTPDAVAVVLEGETLTYAELNARANRLAHHLRGRGVGAETRVGICLERGLEMVAAFLATLKAGGAYVPLDPGYPAGRLAHMLADSGVRLVLTREGVGAALPALDGVERMDLDREGGALAAADEANLEVDAGPDGLAYVIYTSGSTGMPRGVGVQHRSVVRLVRGADYVHLGADETVLQAAPVSFDASILEIWGALLNGGRLVLLPGTAPSLESLGRAIQGQGVSTLWLTAGLFAALVDERLEDLAGVRQLLAGGDVLPVESVRRVRERFPALRLINGYGPTENTTFTCCHTVGEEWNGGPVPIGSPISGTHVYVLDGALRPVPVGIPGELYAGGDGVARGYLGQPAATADRFVPDPFAARPGARMYRTGDRARWRADGAVEYLGRLDAQVKIRGFRVEPGEVESALRRHPAVADCVVVPRDDAAGGRRLVAYVVGQAEPEALREHLRGRLPEYMLPGAFVRLDAIPLTSNGKVDRRALPAPELVSADDAYAAPRTPVEEVLAGIWAEVLGIGRVGVEDGFFDLGGHSLLATRMISRVRAAFGVELELRALFEGPTVAALAERVEALRSAGTPVLPPIVPVERTDALPLSFSQERLWFLDRLEPGKPVYNVFSALRLGGSLDAAAMEHALGQVVRRHEALRTTFDEVDGVPAQVVAPFAGFTLPVHDLSGMDGAAREAQVDRRAADEAARPFDLAAGPLFRATLLRLSEEEHVLLVSMHHIITDGWSMDVLVRELAALYAAGGGGEALLPALPVQYADYAAWQRRHLAGEALDRHLGYWKERLGGAPELLELPTDRPRPAVQTYRGAQVPVVLPGDLLDGLHALARREGATLYMVVLAAYQALLSRYSGSRDVVVGSPVAGRARREVEDLIGFFVNTLVLRTELDGDPSFREVLRRVRDTTLGAWEHQDVPFEKLVAELQPGRSLSHAPLFQVLFSLQNAAPPAGELPGLSLRAVSAETGTSQYDLGLSLTAQAGGARGALTYSTDLFDRATAERMVRHLVRVLEQAAADAETRLADLRLVDDDERRVLQAWSGGGSGYAPRPIHHLVAEQAARTPDAVALAFPGGTLSYGEMDRAANRLANHLAARGAGPEALVGIVAERTPETAVAMLAVLKAGAAYLPLDPAYPAERLRYMLQDSGARLVVAAGALPADADGGLAETVDLRAEADAIAARPAHAPRVAADASNLAYVIYTSGSTGRPKGVAVTHAGVPSLAAWKGARLGQRAGDRALQFASFSFDAAVEELFGALLTGSTLVMAPRDALMPGDALRQTLVRERITFATLPPSVLALMDPAELPELRVVVSAGEALSPAVAARWAGAVELHDAYGPTEATVAATSGRVPAEGSVPSIGRPLENVRAYVLDERMRPVPVGIPGELCVGGAGLARGYLNRPALTAERFVPDPFAPEAGARLYRTGDRARWRADGTLEYGGRLDEQVKVRGFRIELGEIEAALRGHAGVRDCVVVARGGAGDRRLVAYVVGDAEPDALRAHLRASLPEYMVPGPIVRLDALPVTPNGKLDRRALPAPADVAGAGRRLKPETELEARIALICQELLEVGEVGVEDNFFDLGGHSLLLVRLQARLKGDLGRDVPLVDLFQYPTVRSLAAHLQGGPADTGAAAEGEERGGARQAAVSRRLEARRRRDG